MVSGVAGGAAVPAEEKFLLILALKVSYSYVTFVKTLSTEAHAC